MFPARSAALVMSVALASFACSKANEAAPAPLPAEAAEPAAPRARPAPPFTMKVPAKYKAVRAEPPAEAAWESPALSNGFVPTIRVVKAPRAAGSFDEAYVAWKRGFAEGLAATYKNPKVLQERTIEGAGVPGRLIIAVGQLPLPDPKKMPMPLFAFGAVYEGNGFLWVVAGMAAAKLDVATEQITPIDEAEIIAAVSSFRPAAAKP